MTKTDPPENGQTLALLLEAGVITRHELPDKPMQHWGYIGSAEPQSDGSCRGRLLEIQDVVTYAGKDRKDLMNNFRAAVISYLEVCKKIGREPDVPPEPSYYARGVDTQYFRYIRRDRRVCILKAYVIEEIFLLARVGIVAKTRTVSAWCMWQRPDRREDVSCEVAKETAAWLDRYGWHPCPTWKMMPSMRPADRLIACENGNPENSANDNG